MNFLHVAELHHRHRCLLIILPRYLAKHRPSSSSPALCIVCSLLVKPRTPLKPRRATVELRRVPRYPARRDQEPQALPCSISSPPLFLYSTMASRIGLYNHDAVLGLILVMTVPSCISLTKH